MTLGPRAPPALLALPEAAPHVPPREFHALLANASASGPNAAPLVLLDVRNIYETRIGRFEGPGVCTRAFADFPAWVDAAVEYRRGCHAPI